MSEPTRPTLAVHKFSSCDGCQLSILNLEDELLDLVGAVEVAYFLEASSNIQPGPYDIAMVEGSVTTPHEVERIQKIRAESGILIAIGTCATAGGIQSLRNFTRADELASFTYDHPEYLEYLDTSTAISEHVPVDLEIWGCPLNKYQLLEAVVALLQQRKPRLPTHSVCLECKRKGTVCVMVVNGIPCAGPVTRAGCGALCPSYGRGCYGCFGPAPEADLDTLVPRLQALERYPGETVHLLRNFAGYAPKFREAVESILKEEVKHDE
jgi:coenzyme F420-reducing hydrogenase gamma subunit